jgi:endonuclease-3 related protein
MNSIPLKIYHALYEHYGELDWWPARTPYEVMVGAVLTQNTAWSNVERAIERFGKELLPELVARIDHASLTDIVKPAGYYNQKAAYLPKDVALYNNFHAAIVINSKDHCHKSKPLCDTCPLGKGCRK